MADYYSIIFSDDPEASYAHPISYFIYPESIASGNYLAIGFANNHSGEIVFTEINLLIHQFDEQDNPLGKIEKVVTMDDIKFPNENKDLFIYLVNGMDPKTTHGVITFKGYVDEEGLVHKVNKDYCFALKEHIKAEFEAFKRGEYVKFNYLETEPKTLVGVDLINSSPKEKSPIEELSEEEKQRRIDAILNGFNPDDEPDRKVSKESETNPVKKVEDCENDINDLPEHYPKSVLIPPVIVAAIMLILITTLVLVDKFALNGRMLEYSSENRTNYLLTIVCWVLSGLLFLSSIINFAANPRKNFAKVIDRPINQSLLAKVGGTKQYARNLIRFARIQSIFTIVAAVLCFLIIFILFLVINASGLSFH